MYCNKCNYTSFDHLPTCPKCGYEWDGDREKLNLKWVGHNETTWITWEESFSSEKKSQEKKFSFALEDDLPVPSPSLNKPTKNERVQPTNIAKSQTESQDKSDDVEIDLNFSLDETNFASPEEQNKQAAKPEELLTSSEVEKITKQGQPKPSQVIYEDLEVELTDLVQEELQEEKSKNNLPPTEDEVIEISFEDSDFFQKENNVVITNETKTSFDKAQKKATLPQQNSVSEISFPELEFLEVEEDKKHE
ncbi:hypothetical protein [Desulfovulcanus sp.]